MFSTSLADVPKGKHLLVVAYDAEQRKARAFKSTNNKNLGILSADVAYASSTAPTYFPTDKVQIPESPER